MTTAKLSVESSIEECARANATALGLLEQRLKLAMAEGRHREVPMLIAEYNHEQRLVKVAQKRALRLLAGGAR
jgi:hypothetical protein